MGLSKALPGLVTQRHIALPERALVNGHRLAVKKRENKSERQREDGTEAGHESERQENTGKRVGRLRRLIRRMV